MIRREKKDAIFKNKTSCLININRVYRELCLTISSYSIFMLINFYVFLDHRLTYVQQNLYSTLKDKIYERKTFYESAHARLKILHLLKIQI